MVLLVHRNLAGFVLSMESTDKAAVPSLIGKTFCCLTKLFYAGEAAFQQLY